MSDEHPIGTALENRLMSSGIYVTAVEWLSEPEDGDRRHPPDGAGLSIEYETVADAQAITTQEVSAVVRTLLSITDEREWTPGRFEALAQTTDGDRRGRWHVEAAWFDGLGSALSDVDFSTRVLATRETYMNEN